ncbi:MAG: hypothetical protein HQK53_11265 [Oligoflexia bacterium]|nr:hypothetical protein [Oligoflexia bacterium]
MKQILVFLFILFPLLAKDAAAAAAAPSPALASDTAATDVAPINYSINLMWVGKNLNRKQMYIYPARNGSKKDLNVKFLKHIFEWAKVTRRDGIVYLWYDSEMTTAKAVENTQSLINKIKSKHPDWADIVFKDVRSLPEVVKNIDVFSENVPVFFRIDLLRAIAAYRVLTSGESQYFVHADLDVRPLSKRELFDQETREELINFGIVMADGKPLEFENSFQIIGNGKPNLLLAMKKGIIDINIGRAQHILGGGRWIDVDKEEDEKDNTPGDTHPLEQVVYDSYRSMFCYFYLLENWGQFQFRDPTGIRNLSNFFGIDRINPLINFFRPLNQRIEHELEFSHYDGAKRNPSELEIKIPKKVVEIPPSHFSHIDTNILVKNDPNKITLKNFSKKLNEALNATAAAAAKREFEFDNTFLYLAVRNNYIQDTVRIFNTLSAEQLVRALTTVSPQYNHVQATPLNAIMEKNRSELLAALVSIIRYKFSDNRELMDLFQLQ